MCLEKEGYGKQWESEKTCSDLLTINKSRGKKSHISL